MSADLPNIYADFHNADELGRVRLNCAGTLEDLESKRISLQEGLVVWLFDGEELGTRGVCRFSAEEMIWVAVIDWEALKS